MMYSLPSFKGVWAMSAQEADLPANHLGDARDIDVFEKLVAWSGLDVVDVGCADGSLAAALAKRGARVLGIESDPIQAKKNRGAAAVDNVTLIEGSAERIPREAGTVDGVIFSKSLHHVPAGLMDAALSEAARVLKRERGFLFVLEPDISGQFSQLVKPFHDETVVRRQALDALARTADRLFRQMDEYWYTSTNLFSDFAAFEKRMAGSTYNKIDSVRIDTPGVRTMFEAGREAEGYRFRNLMRVRLYREARS
ncbi:MAG: class I SAM-dependent methyltransferase [Alphaproteobacteria bacterium]|nr:class I SAM-dependent methyltransferase [Alphaproteobacteria bacterium]